MARVEEGDAYGRLVLAWHEGERERMHEIVERDDGFIDAGLASTYFAPLRRWPACERRALRLARGRVLDVGVGPGRVALELQRRGHEVLGIDPSPLAIEVARARGVADARVGRLEDVDEDLGAFDTVVMYGNNFGLVRSRTWAPKLLRRLARVTSPQARILAASNDPSGTDDPAHLAYQARNRERGRLPGHLRLRVRYRGLATPWFEYLLATPDEMAELAAAGGWQLVRVVPNDEGSYYVGLLEKR